MAGQNKTFPAVEMGFMKNSMRRYDIFIIGFRFSIAGQRWQGEQGPGDRVTGVNPPARRIEQQTDSFRRHHRRGFDTRFLGIFRRPRAGSRGFRIRRWRSRQGLPIGVQPGERDDANGQGYHAKDLCLQPRTASVLSFAPTRNHDWIWLAPLNGPATMRVFDAVSCPAQKVGTEGKPGQQGGARWFPVPAAYRRANHGAGFGKWRQHDGAINPQTPR